MENFLQKPIRTTLRQMKVGDSVSFPISKLTTVRATASTLGIEQNKMFKTRHNRLNKSIDVFRVE